MNRYARQMMLPGFGQQAQKRLAAARVLVVGAGGLGAPVLQYLCGAGIGAIRLIDPDDVEESNLHRQTLFRMTDLGQPKSRVAASALAGLNPETALEPVVARLDPANVVHLARDIDLIVDCADSFAASYVLSDHAKRAGLPLISASVIGQQGYAGGFCANAPSLRAIFPALPHRMGSCASEGVLGPVVGILGALQAQMAMAVLTGSDETPLGRLVSFDARNYRFGGFSFQNATEPTHMPTFIAASQLRANDVLIDLRNADEGPAVSADALRIHPENICAEAPPVATRTVLCCTSGLRAWNAAEKLAELRGGDYALLATG